MSFIERMSDEFWPLLMLAATLGFFGGSFWESWIYKRILVSKSDPAWRTPEEIHDGFYYIVPEREYVRMRPISETPDV